MAQGVAGAAEREPAPTMRSIIRTLQSAAKASIQVEGASRYFDGQLATLHSIETILRAQKLFDRPFAEESKPEPVPHVLLRCGCGQRSWCEPADLPEPDALGTMLECPKCGRGLSAKDEVSYGHSIQSPLEGEAHG